MDNRMVQVPIALLTEPTLSPSAKVVWMAQRLHSSTGPTALESQTGLSRHTVRNGLGQLAACSLTTSGPRVQIPAALLAERKVGAQAKVLYGLLQATANFRGWAGHFTYAALGAQTALSRNTLKRAVTQLKATNWLRLTQESYFRPIHFTLGSPGVRRSLAEAKVARRRLKRADFGGEALMQEYLSLLIDSDQFTENARPGFLINPLTGERLELDRFYPPNLAFEFHGAQHDGATERFSQAESEDQRTRDLIKAGICFYRDIQLVVIRAADLSLAGMTAKLDPALPLRNLAGHEPLIDFLEVASISYRAAVDAARTTAG